MADTTVSPFTLNLLKHFEGYTARPKWDHKQYSVGYSTRWNPGEPIGSRADHEAALAREAAHVNSWLDRNVSVPMTEQQRAALNSFGFNTGVGSLGKLKDDINSGDWERVGRRMLSWSRAGDDPKALLPRREKEVDLLYGGAAPAGLSASGAPTQPGDNQESKEMLPLFQMLANGGLTMGGISAAGAAGQGTAIPAMASAADPLKNLFGSMGATQPGGDASSDANLAANAMKSAQGGAGSALPSGGQRGPDMTQLASMLKNAGYLGTSLPRRT